jgi:hypothetical protein
VYEKHFKNTFTGRVVYTSAAKAIWHSCMCKT